MDDNAVEMKGVLVAYNGVPVLEDEEVAAFVDTEFRLGDLDEDRLPIRDTERRVPLPKYSRFVVDTQRLWHVVVHNHNHPRYALITSFESGPALDSFIARERA